MVRREKSTQVFSDHCEPRSLSMSWTRLAVTAAMVICVTASATAQSGDGYVGIYADSDGNEPCTSVPAGTARTLYVLALTSGESG